MEKEFPVYLKTLSLPENPLFIRKIKVNGSSCILREQLLSKNVHSLLKSRVLPETKIFSSKFAVIPRKKAKSFIYTLSAGASQVPVQCFPLMAVYSGFSERYCHHISPKQKIRPSAPSMRRHRFAILMCLRRLISLYNPFRSRSLELVYYIF